MTPEQQKVLEFHRTFEGHLEVTPKMPPQDVQDLRYALLVEEVGEFKDAINEGDVAHIAKELADILYVAYGAALAFGFDMAPVFDEVHRSNMTKKGGYKAANGKWIKPATYEPAQIAKVLRPW
jgi:predicted HAD superfamily Cof-like phosphohydrolase